MKVDNTMRLHPLANGVLLAVVEVLRQSSLAVERYAEVHPSQSRGRQHIDFGTELDHPLSRAGRVVGQGGVERAGFFQSSLAPCASNRSMRGPETPASLACALVMTSPMVS